MDDITIIKDNYRLLLGDCLTRMKEIPDGSVDLVVMDPPYNMGKSKDWDKFKSVDYLTFMASVFSECQRVLADNGQMYFFHNDIEKIAELVHYLKHETGLVFSSFLIFPKNNFRLPVWKNPSDSNTLRSWFNTCEYALLYINGKSVQTEWDKTGWDRVRLDVNNFANLRKYAYEMLLFIGGSRSLTAESRSNGISGTEKRSTSSTACRAVTTARRRVFSDVGGKADHFMRFGSTQWSLPTPEVYQDLTERYNLRDWDGFREYEDLRREYEDLRREYEDLRPVHNLDAEHNNVWFAKWKNSNKSHPCEKPVEILERMIRTSSKPGAVILDPFMGSGSTGVACINTGRQFIGIEKDEGYFGISVERMERAVDQQALLYTE